MKKANKKVSHTQGVVAKVRYVAEEDNGYHGILGSGSDTVLLRFSQTTNLHELSPGLLPSMALKFLRDGIESANILTMPTFDETDSWNFFESPFTNRPRTEKYSTEGSTTEYIVS